MKLRKLYRLFFMKNRVRSNKVTKGAPSGFVVSLIFHAVAFFVAGLFVVFTVLPKEEPEFKAPSLVERPKMKLKKPKVKVKKSSQPKPSSRIVAKVKNAKMPEIQIPDLVGTGEGLLGGLGMGGEFMDIPGIPELSEFGSTVSVGNELVGTYWDLKYTRSGMYAPVSRDQWGALYREFVQSDDWDTSLFDRYYKGPRKLYSNTLLLPPSLSAMAPAAFGMPREKCSGGYWIVHYKGKLVHKEGITFRFWVGVDDSLCIRLNGKIVVGASWIRNDGLDIRADDRYQGIWTSSALEQATYIIGHGRATVGDWVTLEPGVPMDMEVVATDNNAANASFIVAVEEKGVEYPTTRQGGPLLPIFRMTELSHDLLDLIYKNLVENEVCCTNGPIFNDFSVSPRQTGGNEVQMKPPDTLLHAQLETWSMKDGTTFEAELVRGFLDKVVFQKAEGSEFQMRVEELSDESRSRFEMMNPPKMRISLAKRADKILFPFGLNDTTQRPPEVKTQYGIKIKQESAGEYNYEMKFEMYIIGQERQGDKKILLDRRQGSFRLNDDNDRQFAFWSDRKVNYQNYFVMRDLRGEKYYGFLIVIRDERGEIIATKTSHNWLFENYENLRKRYVINYINEKCERVYPTQPRAVLY